MNLLAIETSTETCSVALAINGEVLEYYQHAPRQHAELLLPWVEQLFAEAGIGFGSLDAIAFSRGPGSFTSLRIGIGVVQGLAWRVEAVNCTSCAETPVMMKIIINMADNKCFFMVLVWFSFSYYQSFSLFTTFPFVFPAFTFSRVFFSSFFIASSIRSASSFEICLGCINLAAMSCWP